MAKQTSSLATSGKGDIVQFELPGRVEPTIPENSVSAEELCNAGDIVLRGVGKPVRTEMGYIRPVYFQNVDQYQKAGPAPLGAVYWNADHPTTPKELDGILCATVESNDPNANGGIYQFITSHSSPVMRTAQAVNVALVAGDVDDGANGKLAALKQKVSIANPGNRYYYFD